MMKMATDVNDDDDKGNNARLMTSDEGNNCNCDDGKDTCVSRQ
jgi:hypothetical protein